MAQHLTNKNRIACKGINPHQYNNPQIEGYVRQLPL